MPFAQDLDALLARLRPACRADGGLARAGLRRLPGLRFPAAANSPKSTADQLAKSLLSLA